MNSDSDSNDIFHCPECGYEWSGYGRPPPYPHCPKCGDAMMQQGPHTDTDNKCERKESMTRMKSENVYQYRCRSCGSVTPQELMPEREWEGDEYPANTLEGICGQRHDGCGRVRKMDLVGDQLENSSDEDIECVEVPKNVLKRLVSYANTHGREYGGPDIYHAVRSGKLILNYDESTPYFPWRDAWGDPPDNIDGDQGKLR